MKTTQHLALTTAVALSLGSGVSFAVDSGLDYSGRSSHAVSGVAVCGTQSTLKTVSITAPSSGYVLVHANGTYYPNQAGRYLRVALDNAAGNSADTWYHYLGTGQSAFDAGLERYEDFAVQKVYFVNAGTTTTYYLKGCRENSSTTGSLYAEDFTAVFVPRRY
jgi:hypothetical protein